MTENLVDNEHTRRVFRNMAEDGVVYSRYKVESFMKIFWIAAVVAIFVSNYFLLNGSGFTSYAISFISGIMAIKGWQLITPYVNAAEEEGLVEDFSEEE